MKIGKIYYGNLIIGKDDSNDYSQLEKIDICKKVREHEIKE